MLFVIGT